MARPVQLRMLKSNLNDLRTIVLLSDYKVKLYESGDEAEWAEIVNASFGDTKWNVELVHKNLVDRPEFDPKGLFFVTCQGKPIGTCCAWRILNKPETGYVHMLGVMPEHQGKGLGYVLVLLVLKYFKEKGFQEAMLDTDDFRLPAIKTYLKLGFKPVHTDASHSQRWDVIMQKLGNRTDKV